MKTQLAEILEERRYYAIFWQTIGLLVFFAPLLVFLYLVSLHPEFEDFVDFVVGSMGLLSLLTILIMAGLVMIVVSTVLLGTVTTKILRNPQLRSAVNNEMFIANERRAGVWAYYITLFAIVVMFILMYLTPINGKFALAILLFVGTLSAKVAQLILHRG